MALLDTHAYGPYFTIRRPLLSLDELDQLLATHASIDQRDAAAVIRQLLANPSIAAAIALSSPGFCQRLQAASTSAEPAAAAQALSALMKFMVRMSTRSTPFASFASVGLGRLADQPQMALEPAVECRLDIDCGLLLEFDRRIRRQLQVEGSLRLRRAPIVYQGAANYRYVERTDGRDLYRFDLARLERTAHIDRVLARLAAPATAAELAHDLLLFDQELAHGEAVDFIASLCHAGLCELDVGLQVIGGNVLVNYLERLDSAAPASAGLAEVVALRELARRLAALAPCAPAQASAGIAEIEQYLAAHALPSVPGKTVHSDAFASQTDLAICPAQLRALADTIDCLQRLFGHSGPDTLNKFAEQFEQRFGEQFVPLMVALDPETGLEFGHSSASVPWIASLTLPPARARRVGPEEMLSAWLCNELQFGNYSIDLAAIPQPRQHTPPALPNDFAALVTLYAASEAAPFRMALHHISAPGTTTLNARFSARHPALAAALTASVALEDSRRPDAVMAEIVHLPAPRVGNILGRASLGRYEIVLSGIASVAPPNQLTVDDLSLGVVHGKVVLWSQRLNRRVIPRLNSAHNFSGPGNLGLYQFLCTLAQQDTAGVGFMWPRSFRDADFLPRVVHKDVIVAPARWRVAGADLKLLTRLAREARWGELAQWFEARRMPRWFALRHGDNLLETDRTSQLSLAMLADELLNLREATFVESFARLGLPAFHSGAARWHSELVIPVHRPPGVTEPALDRSRSVEAFPRAVNADGERWSYLKVYGGEEYLDGLLLEACQPAMQQAIDQGLISGWFFVRYRDPKFHLRLRWRGLPDGAAALARALSELLQPKLDNHELANIVSDSYLPELRRYGGRQHIAAAEQVFFADSVYCLAIRRAAAQQGGDELVWKGALCGTLDYLDLFACGDPARSGFLQGQRDFFGAELALGDGQKRQLSALYRQHRRFVEDVVAGADQAALAPIRAALRQRRLAVSGAIASLTAGLPAAVLADVVASLIHMQCNRVFIGNSRPQEYVMWDFLVRAHRSVLARRHAAAPNGECV